MLIDILHWYEIGHANSKASVIALLSPILYVLVHSKMLLSIFTYSGIRYQRSCGQKPQLSVVITSCYSC